VLSSSLSLSSSCHRHRYRHHPHPHPHPRPSPCLVDCYVIGIIIGPQHHLRHHIVVVDIVVVNIAVVDIVSLQATKSFIVNIKIILLITFYYARFLSIMLVNHSHKDETLTA